MATTPSPTANTQSVGTVPAAKKAAAKSAKPTVKTTTATARKPAAKKAADKPKPAALAAGKAVKAAKVKKPKMVRDSFTMPKAEFAVLDLLKTRAVHLKAPTKKTELIRAGIKALAAMSDTAFLAAVAAVPNLKTGRPAKS